jgi:hypothetical protein
LLYNIAIKGYTKSQAVRCRRVLVETRVCARVSPCGNCGGQMVVGQVFSEFFSFPLSTSSLEGIILIRHLEYEHQTHWWQHFRDIISPRRHKVLLHLHRPAISYIFYSILFIWLLLLSYIVRKTSVNRKILNIILYRPSMFIIKCRLVCLYNRLRNMYRPISWNFVR